MARLGLYAALLLTACRWHAPYVVVTVDGSGAAGALAVDAAFSNNGQPAQHDRFTLSSASPLPLRFSLQLPNGADGELDVLVASGAQSGENQLRIDGNGEYSLTVQLQSAPGDLSAPSDAIPKDAAVDGLAMPPDLAESPTTWVAQSVPAGTPALLNVWGDGSGQVWAVGYSETILHSSDRGAHWSNVGPGAASDLVNVWGADAAHVVAVGFGPPAILYSSGASFVAATLPSPYNGASQKFLGVWGAGAGDAWAVGTGGAILHSSDLVHWTAQTSGTSKDLFAVWGSGANDVFAVGDSGTLRHSTDGTTWSAVSVPTSAALTNIWGDSDEILLVGAGGVVLRSTDGGAHFTQLSVNGATFPFDGNWGIGAEAFVVSGDDSFSSGSIWHSANLAAGWSQEGAPAGSTAALYGIWGSAYDDVYAVGAGSTTAGFIYHRQIP